MNQIVVATRTGAVGGAELDGVRLFLGVPYAAPPVGELRFRLPQPPTRWEGVRGATDPGPNAPQTMRAFPQLDMTPLVGEGWRKGDDFLTLNIWTPAVGAAGLPVMVFIHGGAFVVGSKDASANDGSGFARSGVVCVAINYRMGVEGFLPIPGAPANLGLHDQLAALAWVRDNIAAFGGDPANVTVFGESAGAMSVADLIASPLAEGLFGRAIVQSGHGAMVRAPRVARRVVDRLARRLRITPDVEGFRTRTIEECLAALEKISRPTTRIDLRDEDGRESAFSLSRFLPVFGDAVLPDPPLEALRKGVGAKVDLLIGSNAEEVSLYMTPTGARRRMTGWMARYTLGRSEPRAREILKAYGLGRKGRRPGDALTEAMTDLIFRLPARQFARTHQGRTHLYEFDWCSPACGGELGACHALEIPFVFDTLARCSGPGGITGSAPPQALADRIHGLWVGFARDGSLPWPQYDAKTRQIFALDKGVAITDPDILAEPFLPQP